ncbi:MAG: hypothetical protein WD509_01290 [Candidatus Paceibacterota bacterium]
MNTISKNILTLLIVFALCVPFGLSSTTYTAHAQSTSGADAGGNPDLGGDDTADDAAISSAGGILSCLAGGYIDGFLGAGASAIGLVVPVNDSLVTSNTGTIKNKDCVLDGLTTVVRDVLISSMTRSIVNWINGGFDGNPAFITDLEGFLLDVGDQVVGTYIEGSELAFLCSPFQLDVRISLALDYYTNARDRVSCTLTGVIENLNDSFDDLSSKNSWDSWLELSVNPHNNPYGSFLASRQAMRQSIASAQNNQQSILNWGSGFRSYEVCDTAGVQDPNDSANISVGNFNCRIATPGVVINEQLSQTLGSGFRQLELADEINEIIGALLGQLSKQVLGGSRSGLSGLSSSRYGRPSYVNQLVSASNEKSESEFRSYGTSVVDGSINTESQLITSKKVSLARLNASETLLKSLAVCYEGKLSTTQNPTLTPEERTTATEGMNTASSTIAASITPLQKLITDDIAHAENNISKLLVIKENLKNTTSQAGVDRVLANELDPLVKDKIIHSQPDFVIATQQKEDISSITDAMNTATNANLTTCSAFPVRGTNQN